SPVASACTWYAWAPFGMRQSYITRQRWSGLPGSLTVIRRSGRLPRAAGGAAACWPHARPAHASVTTRVSFQLERTIGPASFLSPHVASRGNTPAGKTPGPNVETRNGSETRTGNVPTGRQPFVLSLPCWSLRVGFGFRVPDFALLGAV